MPISFPTKPGLIIYLTTGDASPATKARVPHSCAVSPRMGGMYTARTAYFRSVTNANVNLSGRGDKDIGILTREMDLKGA